MSGGVDSSVAALELQRAGYEVVGMTALLFGDGSVAGPCCGKEGADSAQSVCEALGIEHHWIDLSELFEKKVIERFLDEYEQGRTPNPCSDCNRFVKFDTFFEYAAQWDCELLATGHYARIADGCLARAADRSKDQSYFLACIAPEKLARIRFPLGELTKPEVRALASAANLPSAERKESMDVCFMHNGAGLKELLLWHRGSEPQAGDVVTEDGRVVGRHSGAQLYTVGQRRGLALGGGTEGLAVLRIDAGRNEVIVADRTAHPVRALTLQDFTNMAPDRWASGDSVDVRVRYRQGEWSAHVEFDGDRATVTPEGRQYMIAEGQWCVGYRGETVLFGGIIEQVDLSRD